MIIMITTRSVDAMRARILRRLNRFSGTMDWLLLLHCGLLCF